jgi:hypothetical protein
MRVATQRSIESALRRNPRVDAGAEVVAEAIAEQLRSLALREANDQGTYIASIAAVKVGGQWKAGASARHASALEGGTGLWGPSRSMIRARPGKVFAFQTDLPYDGPGGSIGTGAHTGVFRDLILKEHRGMMGRHLVARAAIMVALRGGRALHYRPFQWRRTG